MSKQGRSRTPTFAGRLLIPATALLLGACGGGDGSSAREATANEVSAPEVTTEGLAFAPPRLEIESGTTVRWTNQDDVLHTVTSGEQGEQGAPGVTEDKPGRPDGLFDGKLQQQGATFIFTFDDPGTYPYYCDIHRQMTGEIVVN